MLTIERTASGGAQLDGKVIPRTDVPHAALARGGVLRLGPR
jgi:hypothetical protein